MAARYEGVYNSFLAENPSIERTFPNCVFPAATLNAGPRTHTLPHRDYQNYAGGWCAITALGDFDPTKGGHLILWSLGLAIEFPPGCTIMIPSALLMHSNVPTCSGETRYSFTHFFAGQLVHWVDNGFISASDARSNYTDSEVTQQGAILIAQALSDFPDV